MGDKGDSKGMGKSFFKGIDMDSGNSEAQVKALIKQLETQNAELEKTKVELSNVEQMLLDTQQSAHIGYWWHDILTDEIIWSDEFFNILGIDPQTPTFELIKKVIHPDDLNILTRAMEESASGKEYHEQEFRIIRPDGEIRWIHNRWKRINDKNGREIKRVGTHQDITENKKAAQEQHNYVRFLENMRKINHAIQEADNLDKMMSDVLNVVLSIFSCDRASLTYPCNPKAEYWSVPMECTNPDYPGVFSKKLEIEMDKSIAEAFKIQLETDGPIIYNSESGQPLPQKVSDHFGIKSAMAMALYPKVGDPWQFGIHQCSYLRKWDKEDEKLFQEIGRRLEVALTGLLISRDLKKSEERFRRLAENAQDVVYRMSITDGKYEYISPVANSILGYGPNEWYANPLLIREILHPDWIPYFEEQWANLLKGEMPPTYEYQIVHKSGEVRWLNQRNFLIRGKEDKPIAIEGIITDITQRKQTEEDQREVNDFLQTVIKAAPIAIIGLDLDGKVHSVWNPAAEKMLGWSFEEAVGNYLPSVPMDKKEEFKKFRDAIRTGKSINGVEVKRQRRNGSFIDYSIYASSLKDTDGTITGNVAMLVDITDKKASETLISEKNKELQELVEQLEQSQSMLQLIIESIPIRVFWKDKDFRYLGCNSLFARDAGLETPQQIIGKDDFELGWRDQAELYRDDDRKVMNTNTPKLNIVEPQTTPSGTTIWLRTNKTSLTGTDGKVFGLLGVYEDITEQKQAKDNLLVSEERYRMAQAISHVGNWEYNIKEGTFWGSDEAKRIYGFDPEKDNFTTEEVENCIPEKERVHQALIDLIEKGKPYDLEFEIMPLHSDKPKTIASIAELVYDNENNPFVVVGVIQDITDRKIADKELKKYKEHLEELVLERTKDLEDKNRELENFNELFVGREFRIKELKEKVKELEDKIKDLKRK